VLQNRYYGLPEAAQQDADDEFVCVCGSKVEQKKYPAQVKQNLQLYMYSVVSRQILVLIAHPLHRK
jgi:hypothetical protein